MQSTVFSVPLPNPTSNIQQLEITATLFSIIDTSTMLFCYYIPICDTNLIVIFFFYKQVMKSMQYFAQSLGIFFCPGIEINVKPDTHSV